MDFAILSQYVVIFLVLLAVGAAFFVAWSTSRKKYYSDKDLKKILTAWDALQTYSKGDADRVFLEGDKLIDHILKLRGYQGSMADKMRKAKSLFAGEYQSMWWIHKQRNALAHEIGYEVTGRDADRALRILRRILKLLKVL